MVSYTTRFIFIKNHSKNLSNTDIPTKSLKIFYSEKMAIIDKSSLIGIEYLMNINFLSDNTISKQKLFPGYMLITPWSLRTTYFLPIFERFLAKLFEAGIERKMYLFVLSALHYRELSVIALQIETMSVSLTTLNAKLRFMSLHGTDYITRDAKNSEAFRLKCYKWFLLRPVHY